MEKLKSLHVAVEEILRRYERSPKGWRVTVSRDRAGHRDVIVTHGTHVWLIKEHEINPFKSVGFAAEMKGAKEEGSPIPDFGLRPVPDDMLSESLEAEGDPSLFLRMLKKVLKQEPVPLSQAMGLPVLQGPIMYSPRPLDLISQRSRELDVKLKNELERMLLRKYPQTIVPYM
ncbi:MAG: hypothetical protein QXO32_01115 [Candidatus Bathyarchaeia archaeon]